MSVTASLWVIVLLIACSAFLAMAELAMASARSVKLRQLADEGDARAAAVLAVQAAPGSYFTVVQIGQNMVAILGGVVGDGAFSPTFERHLSPWLSATHASAVALVASVLLVTSLFILLADLIPKRVALAEPEALALRLLAPMRVLMWLLHPMVRVFNGLANALVRLLGLPDQRDDRVTSGDILALTEAGTQAGALKEPEQRVIENVFELDTRTVESAMTTRNRIVHLLQGDAEDLIRARIAEQPHSTYLVCRDSIDQVLGYVDATDLFARVLRGEPISLQGDAASGLIQRVLMVPDRLTLSEMLKQFREAHEDFAVIVNEYSLVVGVITLNDVMSTVMGTLVAPHDDEPQIVRRGDGSWLMDGLTPIGDVLRAIDADPAELPQRGQYDTLAGFLMVMLRRIPRRTDVVVFADARFEVLDVDSAKVDQVLVTRQPSADGGPPSAPHGHSQSLSN
jgi:CBS domain containing-hemolysin-like protein